MLEKGNIHSKANKMKIKNKQTNKKLTNSGMKNMSGKLVKTRPPDGKASPEVVEAIVQNTIHSVCVCVCVCVYGISLRVRCVTCFKVLLKTVFLLLYLPLCLLYSTHTFLLFKLPV